MEATPKPLENLDVAPSVQMRKDWNKLLEFLSYKGIINNIPFILYVVFLGVIYITANQQAIETQKELDKQQLILKELNWKHIDIKTQLMHAGMESHVIRNASALGLKPLTLPAYKIQQD